MAADTPSEKLSKTDLRAQGFYEERTKWGRYMFLDGDPLTLNSGPQAVGAIGSVPRKIGAASKDVGRVLREAYSIREDGELVLLTDQERAVLELRLRFPWLVDGGSKTTEEKPSEPKKGKIKPKKAAKITVPAKIKPYESTAPGVIARKAVETLLKLAPREYKLLEIEGQNYMVRMETFKPGSIRRVALLMRDEDGLEVRDPNVLDKINESLKGEESAS